MYGQLIQDSNGGRLRLEMTVTEARELARVIPPGIPQLPPDALTTLRRGLLYLLEEPQLHKHNVEEVQDDYRSVA